MRLIQTSSIPVMHLGVNAHEDLYRVPGPRAYLAVAGRNPCPGLTVLVVGSSQDASQYH
jgi:hypothetical protein